MPVCSINRKVPVYRKIYAFFWYIKNGKLFGLEFILFLKISVQPVRGKLSNCVQRFQNFDFFYGFIA